ncbi:GPW/gp25 family protein [Chitinimonas arctica]|uniref:GPW/gp25 family protein n=1 Tax=Chitinimonas arctica TaxID=2594795 RepID=A0A516SLG2_9NEIS|nr:GPW/gp25 family protein [Chitinimonas arctica]QDQ28996.1 GPW/gp25 family protein [Chitinimonas arctica]
MHIDFPLHFNGRGCTATTDEAGHIRDMIEQLLFTQPGERVNRPDFGCGLLQLVFAPNSPELAAVVQLTVQAAMVRWLGDVVEVRDLQVQADEASLSVDLDYLIRASGQAQNARFQRQI